MSRGEEWWWLEIQGNSTVWKWRNIAEIGIKTSLISLHLKPFFDPFFSISNSVPGSKKKLQQHLAVGLRDISCVSRCGDAPPALFPHLPGPQDEEEYLLEANWIILISNGNFKNNPLLVIINIFSFTWEKKISILEGKQIPICIFLSKSLVALAFTQITKVGPQS